MQEYNFDKIPAIVQWNINSMLWDSMNGSGYAASTFTINKSDLRTQVITWALVILPGYNYIPRPQSLPVVRGQTLIKQLVLKHYVQSEVQSVLFFLY